MKKVNIFLKSRLEKHTMYNSQNILYLEAFQTKDQNLSKEI